MFRFKECKAALSKIYLLNDSRLHMGVLAKHILFSLTANKNEDYVPTKKVQTLSKDEPKSTTTKKKVYSKLHFTNDLDFVLHTKLDQIERILISAPKKAHNQFKVVQFKQSYLEIKTTSRTLCLVL